MLRARRREQQGLRFGSEVDLACVEEHVADALGERSSAGFPSEKDVAPAGAEALGEATGLHGFSGCLAALE